MDAKSNPDIASNTPETAKKPQKVTEADLAKTRVETYEHIMTVARLMSYCIEDLLERAASHDASKLAPPEVDGFAAHKVKLANLTYGTPEYEENRKSLEDTALKHHYAHNRHHPDHFPNGINGMTLLDLLEMFCDWSASTKRQHDGNLLMSIEKNAERFGISKQLLQILKNTAEEFDKIAK